MKTSLGIWALGSMVTRFVPGGYQPQWAGETTAERVPRAIDGSGRPHRRLRVPLPAGARRRQPRRGARGARRARHLLHRDGPPPRPALRQGRARARRTTRRATEAAEAHPRRAVDFAGELGAHFIIWPGDRGLQLPVPDAVRRQSGRWLIDGDRPGRASAARSTASRSSSSTRTPSRR